MSVINNNTDNLSLALSLFNIKRRRSITLEEEADKKLDDQKKRKYKRRSSILLATSNVNLVPATTSSSLEPAVSHNASTTKRRSSIVSTVNKTLADNNEDKYPTTFLGARRRSICHPHQASSLLPATTTSSPMEVLTPEVSSPVMLPPTPCPQEANTFTCDIEHDNEFRWIFDEEGCETILLDEETNFPALSTQNVSSSSLKQQQNHCTLTTATTIATPQMDNNQTVRRRLSFLENDQINFANLLLGIDQGQLESDNENDYDSMELDM
ncbi:hypothetical protein ABK040_004042 [Willaertia magna]